jgi:hypothetical protein
MWIVNWCMFSWSTGVAAAALLSYHPSNIWVVGHAGQRLIFMVHSL